MFGEYVFREAFVLQGRTSDLLGLSLRDLFEPTSSTTKLSPSFPHLTTLSSCGFSSILCECQRMRSGQICHFTDLYSLRTWRYVSFALFAPSHGRCTHKVARVVGASRLRAVHGDGRVDIPECGRARPVCRSKYQARVFYRPFAPIRDSIVSIPRMTQCRSVGVGGG